MSRKEENGEIRVNRTYNNYVVQRDTEDGQVLATRVHVIPIPQNEVERRSKAKPQRPRYAALAGLIAFWQ